MDRPEAEGDLRVRGKVVETKGAEAPFYALWIRGKVAGIGQKQPGERQLIPPVCLGIYIVLLINIHFLS